MANWTKGIHIHADSPKLNSAALIWGTHVILDRKMKEQGNLRAVLSLFWRRAEGGCRIFSLSGYRAFRH
jgi:hypothetical protein